MKETNSPVNYCHRSPFCHLSLDEWESLLQSCSLNISSFFETAFSPRGEKRREREGKRTLRKRKRVSWWQRCTFNPFESLSSAPIWWPASQVSPHSGWYHTVQPLLDGVSGLQLPCLPIKLTWQDELSLAPVRPFPLGTCDQQLIKMTSEHLQTKHYSLI